LVLYLVYWAVFWNVFISVIIGVLTYTTGALLYRFANKVKLHI